MSEQEWLDIFGDNLRDILIEKHMSQEDLARICGVTQAAVSGYIHKRKMPGIKTILNMSYALNINLYDLIDFGEPIELSPRVTSKIGYSKPEHRINWDEFEDLEDY